MIPTWLKRKLGIMHPTARDEVREALDRHLDQATESNIEASKTLSEVREIRPAARDAHERMTRLREENHFADLMTRALQGGAR